MKTITVAAAARRNDPDGVKASLGHHLGERRQQLGISIEQLMLSAGLRRWQLFRVEQGTRPIPRQWFEDAAAALNRLEAMQQSGGAGE